MAITIGHKAVPSDFTKTYFHGYQTAVQALANATWVAITFTGEVVDTISGHSVSSNTSRYTPTTAGYYKCVGQVTTAVSTAGDRVAQFRKNGSVVTSGSDGDAPYSGVPSMKGTGLSFGMAFAWATIKCNGSTDYIELYGQQNSGGSLNTASDTNSRCFFIAEWVAPL